MRVRVKNNYSRPRPVPGGSPQGTILGNFLFFMTTDNLEDRAVEERTDTADESYATADESLTWSENTRMPPWAASTSSEENDFLTPMFSSPTHQQTSTPTSRGQFARLTRVGNITSNLDGTYDSTTGEAFCRQTGHIRRIESFSTSSSGSDADEEEFLS